MYLEIDLNNTAAHYVLYKLTTQTGDAVHIGVVPFNQLTAFSDVPDSVSGIVYLSVIMTGIDRLVLADYGLKTEDHVLHERLAAVIKSWSIHSSKQGVMCVETLEQWPSAAECARDHDLTYGALLKHLDGEKSFNSVKGRTYRKVGA